MSARRRGRWLFNAVVLAALIVSVLPPVSPARAQDPDPSMSAPAVPQSTVTCPTGQFLAQYYNGTSFSGTPVLERCETAPLAYDGTAVAGPGVPATSFTARYTGNFLFVGEKYHFLARADNKFKLIVDGTTRLERTSTTTDPASYITASAMISGTHSIQIDFTQDTSTGWNLYAGWLPELTSSCPTDTLRADYYANTSRSGTPLFSRCEQAPIHGIWGSVAGPYGLRPSNFSAHWLGSVMAATEDSAFPPGEARFVCTVKGHMRATVTDDSGTPDEVCNFTNESNAKYVDRTYASKTTRTIEMWYESTTATGSDAALHFSWGKQPKACGVPGSTMVGRDEELFVTDGMNGGGYALNQAATLDYGFDWLPDDVCCYNYKSADVVKVNAYQQILVGLDGSNQVGYYLLDSEAGKQVEQRGLLKATGVAVLSRGADNFVIFARPSEDDENTPDIDETRTIQYADATVDPTGIVTLAAWATVPGVGTDARDDADGIGPASNLAVLAPDPNHMLVFYKNSAHTPYVTEWVGGAWWTEPRSLGGMILSDLAAAAPNPSYVVLLGIDSSLKPVRRVWTAANEPDWSDVESWTVLSNTQCQIERMAVGVRSTYEMMAACRTLPTRTVLYWQWSSSSGWTAGAQAGSLIAIFGPLTLVPIDTNKVWLEWATPTDITRAEWTESGGWGAVSNTKSIGSQSVIPGRVIVTVPQPGWANHFVLQGTQYHGYRWQRSSAVAQHWVTPTPSLPGVPRGQALVKVDGKTVWVTTAQTSNKGWTLSLANPQTNTAWATYALTSSGSSDWRDGLEGLTYGDYDLDGDDEVAIFLRDASTPSTAKLFTVDMSWSGTTLNKTVTWQNVSSGSSSFVARGPVSAALGDLNGDGKRTELVLAAYLATGTTWLWLYEYANGVFTLQSGFPHNLSIPNFDMWVDMQIAIGHVRNIPGEQLVVSQAECPNASSTDPKCNRRLHTITAYQYQKSGTTWTKTKLFGVTEQRTTRELLSTWPRAGSPSGGPLGTALVLADVDGDALKEIVFSIAKWMYAYGGDVATQQADYGDDFPDRTLDAHHDWIVADYGLRSLAAGDIDRDAREEILEFTGLRTDSNASKGFLWDWFEWTADPDDKHWVIYESDWALSGHVALIGDVDNDSLLAVLTTCQPVVNAQVVAVVYSAPRYYDAEGEPLQEDWTRFAVSKGGETGTSSGVTVKTGASLELEFTVVAGIAGIIGSEDTTTLGYEFEYSWNRTVEKVQATESTTGYSFYTGPGTVVYTKSEQTCYHYDLYNAATMQIVAQTQVCSPKSGPDENRTRSMSITKWNNADTRRELASIWFPLGHDNNDVYTYPAAVPSGYNILWQGDSSDPISAEEESGSIDWSTNTTTSSSTTTSNSIMNTFSFKEGLKFSFPSVSLSVEIGVSAGAGPEWGSTVAWSEGIEAGATLFYPLSADCAAAGVICYDYTVRPYLATAEGQTLGGHPFNYLVFDYAVPSPPPVQPLQSTARPRTAGPAAAARLPQGPLPQAPVVTSPTHPDENAWSTNRNVTFNWQQPAGDPATIIGYSWQLGPEPDELPKTASEPGNTYTYQNLKDGVHYLHIQAARQELPRFGPVAHRAVRIDGDKPAVKIALDPPSPGGSGWYNTPVTAEITADDGLGSGVAAIEYSTDGSAWQPYGGPLTLGDDTAGLTLYARARDNVGHTSDAAQVEIKIDQTPPSTVDADSYGLSYARIDQDESGNNVQLVLGGALNDSLSGRAQVEISAGDAAAMDAGWQAVDAIGEFPMPPGNLFPPGQATTLNWIYTPTFEIRGVYNIYGHGIDLAGNRETGWGTYPIGTLFWPPDGNPNLAESRLTASPSIAHPGETVHFTLGLRNGGVQEAAVKIVGVVQAGLTVVPESISSGGTYDGATREVKWQVHAAWPNQIRYLTFDAVVDQSATGQLHSQANLLAYWPGYEDDPSKLFSYTLTNAVTVVPGAPGVLPPQIVDARVVEGPAVGNRQITLNVLASSGAQYLYVKEWTLDPATGAWVQVAVSGWLPISGLTFMDDVAGRHVTVPWTLTGGDGVHYLGVWAGDGNRLPSNLNEAGLIFTNLIGTPTALAAGGRVQYRLPLTGIQEVILALVTTSGDADLFVWNPRTGFKPASWSNGSAEPPSLESVTFQVPDTGDYLVEVHAVSDAHFVLALDGALKPVGAPENAPANVASPGQLPEAVHNADKQRPEHPVSLSTPLSLPGADVPGGTVPPTPLKLYLPLVTGAATTSGPAAPVVPETYPARQRTR